MAFGERLLFEAKRRDAVRSILGVLIASTRRFKWADQVLSVTEKSFLVLFFKKERLPSLRCRLGFAFRGGVATGEHAVDAEVVAELVITQPQTTGGLGLVVAAGFQRLA